MLSAKYKRFTFAHPVALDSMIHGAFGYNFYPCAYSDHDLVSVKLKCKQTLNCGPGLWKLNCSLLSNDSYTRLMSQFLQDWRTQKERYPDLRTRWDIGKFMLEILRLILPLRNEVTKGMKELISLNN